MGKHEPYGAARQGLMQAAGTEAPLNDDQKLALEQAWAQVVHAQTLIALDKNGGSKATSAARFVAQMAGFDQPPEAEPDPLQLTAEEARALKGWLALAGYPPDG